MTITLSGIPIVWTQLMRGKVREHVLQRPNSETLRQVPATIIIGETSFSGEDFERQLSLQYGMP